jgi:hypothetical protein
VEIELSVTFAPELREAVREAADEAGLSLSEWLAQAAEAKIRADGQARILEEAERERRRRGLREFLDEYQAEHGAFTDEEMARARRWRELAEEQARESGGQARLARALRNITVESITGEDGMRAGELLDRARLRDAIGASVALLAGPGDRVLTSDPGDLRRLCDAARSRAVVVDC